MHDITTSRSLSVKRDLGTTISFNQALKDKYIDQEEFDNKLIVPKDKIISTDITFVGFGKVTCIQKQLKRLSSIDLSSKNIECAGDLEDIGDSLRGVEILNLANNNLSWEETTLIIKHLPNLKELILTNNPLKDKLDNYSHNLFKKPLNLLTLGRVHLDWSSIIEILSSLWPSVDQLDLWSNNLSSSNMILSSSSKHDSFTRHLRLLKLSHNCFSDIDWLQKVGMIENLVELDISNCGIISIDISSSISSRLENLEILNLSYNNLNDWRSISSLNSLKNLRSLICHENPIFITEKFAKAFTIGRLSKIKILNREEFSQSTRRDSEILYLRKTFPLYLSFKDGKNDNFQKEHPRYEELVNNYGIPDDLIKKEVKDKYVTVHLCLKSVKITKKLPCDMRVANLRMLIKRLFKLKPSCNIEIICEPQVIDSSLSYSLDKDSQTLDFFSVKNDYNLLIEMKNN